MPKEKTQTKRILDGFVTAVVIVTALTLIASGISISKINTEYLETGVRASKIVAERKSQQILVTQNEAVLLKSDKKHYAAADKILTFLPPPVNTVYLSVREILSVREKGSTVQ
ncbi:MAG: hypothetical protein MJ168_07340 [Clostridia bacterium]|nr:hypothetical protein [Clostridia bacterium]